MKLELPDEIYVGHPQRTYLVCLTIQAQKKWWVDRLRTFGRRLIDREERRVETISFNTDSPPYPRFRVTITVAELRMTIRVLSLENVCHLLTWADGLNENLKVKIVEVIW